MSRKLFAGPLAAVILIGMVGVASATPANWVDWTSTTTGTLTIGGESIAVSMTGSPYGLIDGEYYYNNSSTGFTNANGTYAGLAPSDLIQVNAGSTFTLNFDKEIVNPYIALVSVGQSGLPVEYAFSSPFSVVSFGSNYWGYSGYSADGNDFTGREYNGVLQLQGTFNSITFTTNPAEYWHGFNFGVAEPVPEPATMLLFGTGLAGLVSVGRRKKK